MSEYALRFILGGTMVSAFALLGDLLRPKSFAGLFGAAPSVALATLGIAVISHDAAYAAAEAKTMILGAVALALYSLTACQLMMRMRMRALGSTLIALVVWLATAFGLFALLGGFT